MANFADLILGADTRQMDKAVHSLDDVVEHGARAEKATDGVGKGFDKAGTKAQTARPKIKGFATDAMSVEKVATMAARSLGVLAAGFISIQGIGSATAEARAFNASISETSTLIEGTPRQMAMLEESARSMGVQFGTTGKQQVEAFYQAISAGAGDVRQSAELLEQSNKFAIGGVTSTTIAVDALTTATNSYKASNLTAAQASDAMFVGIRAGKTTAAELGAALGNVLPIASALNVSFDEVVATTAALTTQGLTTAQSVTGLRAALTAVTGPTKQASDLAAQLGIEFNTAAIESMGLKGFLDQIVVATGGSADAMRALFGSVEATTAVLALAGGGSAQLTSILEQMENKLGATETAFQKINSSLDGRLNRATAALGDILLGLGNVILPILVPAAEAMAGAMMLLANNTDALGVAIGILAASKIPALISGMLGSVSLLSIMEVQFIAGAVAARGMAVAMNLIPGVAIFTGITAALTSTYRAYGEARDRAEEYAASAEVAAKSKKLLNEQLGIYIKSHAPQARDLVIKETQAQIEHARSILLVAEANVKMFETHRNGLNPALRNTEAMLESQARAEEYKIELEGLRIQLSSLLRDTRDTAAGLGDTGSGFSDLSAGAKEATAQVYTVIPSLIELREEYGASAEAMRAVLMAQNELAEADASAGFQKVLATVLTLNETLGLGADKVAFLKADIEAIGAMDTFGQQSRAIAEMASYIFNAAGGLDNMDANTRGVYQALLAASVEAGALGSQIAIAEASTTTLGAAIARIAPQFAPAIVAANNLAAAIANIVSQMGGLASGLLRLSTSASAVANVTSAAGGFLSGLSTKVLKSASTGLAGVAANLSAVFGQSQKSGASVQSLGKHLNSLVNPAGSGGGGGGAAKKLSEEAKEAARQLKEAERAAEQLEDAINRPLVSAIDGFANAIGDFVAGGLRDFKKLGQAILNTIVSSISQAIAFAVANPIKIALGLSGGLTGGVAQAATGAAGGGGGLLGLGNLFGGGGGGGLLGGLFGSFGGGGSILGLGGLGGGTGFLGGLGNAISGGLGNIFSIGANAAAAGGGLLASLGAAVPVLGAIGLAVSFFRKKITELDRGIRVTVDGMDTLVETFQTLETKRFWGLSKKVRTTYTEADEDVAAPLQNIVAEIQDSLISAAETLGITSSVFTDFAHQMEVSTRGMSDEEAQRAVQDALEELGDAFAEMVTGIEDVQRVGEGAATTLTRLSTSLLAVNDAMDLLGGTLFDVSLLGGDAASNLVDAFGGADQMAQAVNTFFAAFYSVEEQRETIMRRLNDQFAELGQTMPQSREGFRELIESIDLTTEYGRELYAALVSMAGAMNEVLPQIERFTLSMQGLVSNIGGEIGVLIEQSQALALQSGEQARLWYKTAKTLREFLSDILNSDLTNVSPAQQAALNQSRFDTALAAAMEGDQSAADKIPELSRNLLKSMKAQSGTLVEYQMQAAVVMNQLKLLAGVADLEGANEDVLQALYERQIEVLTALANFLELESLTPEQIASLDSSIQDLVTNWDATIGEFDAALLSLEAAIRDAEDFSYSQLQERLSVSVNLLAQADIPEYLKQLIATAETGVQAFIDFVVRDDDLTPDQKWLLTNHFSNHFSEIELAMSSASNPMALALALRDTFDSLIIFDLVLNPASDKMVRHLATVDESLHKIGVTVDLSNHPDPLIRALFEYRQSLHEAQVKAIVSDSSDPLALKAVGGKASSIKVNTSLQVATNSDARAVRMSSTGPSNHKINVGVDLRGEVHDGVRRMGFSSRSDHRIKTHLDKVGQTDAALLRLGSESRSDHRVKAHLDKVGQTDATLLRLGSSGKTSHRVKTYLDKVGQTNAMLLRLGADDRSNHRIKTSVDQAGGVGSILSRVARGPVSQHLVNTGVDLRGSVHNIVRRVGASNASNHLIRAGVDLTGGVNRIISRLGASGLTNHLINAGIDLRGDVHTLVRRLGASSGTNHRINTLLALNPQSNDLVSRLGAVGSTSHTISTLLGLNPNSNPLVRMMGHYRNSSHTINTLLGLNQNSDPLVQAMGRYRNSAHTINTLLALNPNSNPLVRTMGHYRNSSHTINTLLRMDPGSNSTIVDVLRRPFSTVNLDMETYFTEQQQHLLDTLLLGPNGTITIGGQFEFEPSQLFSTWFESTAQDLFMNPMSNLSAMLDELRAAVIADTQQREEELARQAQIANLQRWGMMAENRLEQNLVGAFDAAQAIRDLEQETGVHLMTGNQLTDLFMNEDGTINYDATSVAVGPGGNLAAFNEAFRGPNGLEAQLLAANQGITTEGQMVDELARRLMLIGQQASFSVWADFFGQVGSIDPSTPDAPPPLVYQSPRREVQMSPITSLALKQQTDSAKESATELKAVRTELAAARKEQEKQSATLLEYQKKISTVLTKFDVVGLPPERT